MFRVITDSSCDLHADHGNNLYIAPMAIITDQRQYRDDETLDVAAMLSDLADYEGRTTTACPSVGAWLDAMEGAHEMVVITITSHLSGAYNSALAAKELYLQSNPDAKIAVIDSLTTGPELRLLAEKAMELSKADVPFDEAELQLRDYSKNHTRLFFTLQSLHNMAQNGRVSKIVAAAVGVLGIRIVATASTDGELEPLHKARGDKRALDEVIRLLKEAGYAGGRLRIAHVQSEKLAENYAETIRQTFPTAEIQVTPSTALCSFYAEKNGILLGVETE